MTEQVAQQEAQQPQQENFDLTLQDLGALRAIIDIAAQRGAFKPAEMTAVGTVYNKLTGFLDNVAKQQQAQQAEQPQG